MWNKTTNKTQFYLTSLPANAKKIGQALRKHWTIENKVHWILDVTFREDDCRIRSRYGDHNFYLLRRLAINALSLEKNSKVV
ncbi:MAG: ISAs1 family transposase [Oscillatoria sp. SIO1A7]|nr:ISAs1 family transposase [Oscillatoria sp. SIO1A7]